MSEKKQSPAREDDEAVQFGDELPVLPIRNAVLFPGAVAPFDVGREKSVALVEDVDNLTSPVIAIFAQRDPSTDDPGKEDLHHVGCAARVLKALKHSSGNYSLILQGLTRIRLDEMTQTGPYLKAKISRLQEQNAADDEAEALSMSLRDIAKQVIQLMPELPREAGSLIDSIQAPGALADLVAGNLDAPVDEKAGLLETIDVKDRIRKVLKLLTRQLEILKMRERINSQIKEEMGKNQREYVLRQQLKAIKEELGEDEGDQGDLDGIEERIAKATLPQEAEQVAKKQLKRLRNMQVGSAEYTVVRTYLDWILDLPWHMQTPDNMDIGAVRKVLDEDHYGLEKVKKRILEYPAVRKLKKDKKGADLVCSSGRPASARRPPNAEHRSGPWAVSSCVYPSGAWHDEAAIRGHRRTYVGALPGQIIQGMKKASTINPVFMMDEVDKIGHDFRGDPAAALLEEARPRAEQHLSADHYLEIPYDLSNVMFVATPRTSPIPSRRCSATAWRSWRSSKAIVRREKPRDRPASPHPAEAARRARHHQRAARHHRPGRGHRHRHVHARGWRPDPRAADRQHHPRRGREDRRGRHHRTQDRERRPGARLPRRAEVHERGCGAHRRGRRRHRNGFRRASAVRSSSSRRRACTAPASSSSPASSVMS